MFHRKQEIAKRKDLEPAGSNIKAFSFIRGLFVTSALVSSTGAGSTGNSLVTCAACQVSEAQFGPWNCQVNCDVVSSENGVFLKCYF